MQSFESDCLFVVSGYSCCASNIKYVLLTITVQIDLNNLTQVAPHFFFFVIIMFSKMHQRQGFCLCLQFTAWN